MSENKKIPLHAQHAAAGARFVPFGGWEMPVQYSGILEEHRAVREACGLFDVSHMGEFWITGPDAARFLDYLLVNLVAGQPDGKAIYSPMCAEDGGVIDDLIVYKDSEVACFVCVNASNIEKDLAWMQDQLQRGDFACQIEDQSADYALLAVQGPLAGKVAEASGLADATQLKRFQHCLSSLDGTPVRIARTGYTGEDGFEIYVAASGASALFERLLEAGTPLGMKLCGLGARDSLRLEAGLPLYGHELSAEIDPISAGFGWTVKLRKAAFIGRDALATIREAGPKATIIHFTLEGRRIAREGTPVLADGEVVGRVLSGTLSPMLNAPIGSALVATANQDAALYVDLRGHRADLSVKRPPLHRG